VSNYRKNTNALWLKPHNGSYNLKRCQQSIEPALTFPVINKAFKKYPIKNSINKSPVNSTTRITFHFSNFLSIVSGCCLLLLSLYCVAVQAQSAIASAHPLATRSGEEILQAGGNAFDAAIAVSATLGVVEPASSGFGGGGFWLLHRAKDNYRVMLDGREAAPIEAGKDLYQDELGEVMAKASIDGPLAAGIPGMPAALVYLAEHFGKLPLSTSLAPAIKIARQGFKSGPHYQRMASFRRKVLLQSPDAARIFLRQQQAPEPGTLIQQPELADTLEAMAKHGFDGFYRGATATKLVQGVRSAGGIWRMEDLANYRVKLRQPIVSHYKQFTITSAAPPSSGGIGIATMLNILSAYPLSSMNEVQRIHTITEAMRRAYRDRAVYLGDPDYVKMPLQRLTNPYYADGLRASIRMDKATPSDALPGIDDPEGGNDTTHFSIVDEQGNRVAATLSVNYPFGSCFMPPGTGILLNDEMDDFSAKPGSPNAYGLIGSAANAIAPGKRPLSSMSPTFVDGKQGFAVLGTPGGSRIISMVMEAILNYSQGLDAQHIVAAPRFHHQFMPDKLYYEKQGLKQYIVEALRALGHHPSELERKYGNMQVVVQQADGKLQAASDPRGEGLAIVLP